MQARLTFGLRMFFSSYADPAHTCTSSFRQRWGLSRDVIRVRFGLVNRAQIWPDNLERSVASLLGEQTSKGSAKSNQINVLLAQFNPICVCGHFLVQLAKTNNIPTI